jgi:hypothetical protein
LATGGGSINAVLASLKLTTGGGLKAGVSTSNGI